MHHVCEVGTLGKAFQGPSRMRGIGIGMRQVEQPPQACDPLLPRPAIGRAEHPFELKENGRRNFEAAPDGCVRRGRLTRIVSREKPHEDVRVEGADQTSRPRSRNIASIPASISSSEIVGPL